MYPQGPTSRPLAPSLAMARTPGNRKRRGKIRARFWHERDSVALHRRYRERPCRPGAWIVVRRQLVFSWFPARVIVATYDYEPRVVWYYGDRPPRVPNGATTGMHKALARGAYLFRELQLFPTSTYAVLPRWMDLSDIHTILDPFFTGWTTLKRALQDLEILCDDHPWWDRVTKRRIRLDYIPRSRIYGGREDASK